MKNQKFLAVASAAVLLSSSPAFAKTEGNYVGVNLNKSSAQHRYKQGNAFASNYSKFDDDGIGFGLDYKYAFNFDNFFIAPGIFAETISTKAKDQDKDSVSIDNRYGLKADIGYDFSDQFAVYFTNGVASSGYEVNWKSATPPAKKSGNESGYFYGLGLIYNLNKNVTFNIEYNTQTLDLATPNLGGINTVETDLSVLKFGASYHF